MAASDKSVAVSFTTDFSSDSTVSDGWQELTKSDYAKVIFSDLLCNTASSTVECKFQITDNVHEDPNDYVGLFRIGYEDLSQCLVSKMLSQTKCEDDGKLQRCVFTANELPYLDDGFYQFLYVTRDQEVCGASMPFQIKMSPFHVKESSLESGASEKMDGGFLIVSNEMERKVKEESNEQEKISVQRSALSKQKKEEIAAWVSQNPDYYSLIEQIKEHTFTIDALQQSKDLAMKEVAQLYEILNQQNGELIQLKNMLAAYEEKIKMSQSLQEEKTAELNEMEKSLTGYEEKLKIYELAENEKDKQLSQMKEQYQTSLKASLARQDQQVTEINDLKKELEEMREMQKAKECHLVTAEIGHSMENLIQKAQDFVRIVSDTIKNIDFTDEDEKEKFFQLKIQLLIILSKMTRATDLANICDRNGMHKTIHSIMNKDVKGNSSVGSTSCALENRDLLLTYSNTNAPEGEKSDFPTSSSAEIAPLPDSSEKEPKNSVGSTSCALENRDLLLTNSNTNAPEVEKSDFPTSSSVEIAPFPDSSEKEPTNKDAPKEVVQRIPFKKVFESEVLEHQITELPRLDVINKDTAMTLQTDRLLDIEDVTVINRLTEKIIKRGFNLYEAIELVDDSCSDSGSDVSEISECPSIKKDLLTVGRVMEALSSTSLSNQTNLEQLVVVENEEDKNLISRKKWDVLLQKCALHYQIEILLEHIQKQKEGMKKVTDNICELMAKNMLLRDEMRGSKAVSEKLKTVMDKKDMHISKLKRELEFKNSLLCHFGSEKEQLENRAELAERTVEDFHARIVEASNLYKNQYTEIQKLSKKLQKYKLLRNKTKASKGDSSLISSESSKTASSFEVVQTDSVQNVNDSDTGEHMFEKASLVSDEEKQYCNSRTGYCAAYQPSLNPLDDKASDFRDPFDNASSEMHVTGSEDFQKRIDSTAELKTAPERCASPPIISLSAADFDYFISNTATEACGMNHEAIQPQIDSNKEIKALTGNCSDPCLNQLHDLLPSIHELESEHSTTDKPNTEAIECHSYQSSVLLESSYDHFQKVIKDHFADIKKPTASRNSQKCFIRCCFCKEIFPLGPEVPSDLMNHFEDEHSIKICPVCGQLFEDAIPQKYFLIHVDQHFTTE